MLQNIKSQAFSKVQEAFVINTQRPCKCKAAGYQGGQSSLKCGFQHPISLLISSQEKNINEARPSPGYTRKHSEL